MTRSRFRLCLRLSMGVPILLIGASCVPDTARPSAASAPREVTTTDALLRGMALAVPTDVAHQPLPADDRPLVLANGAPPFQATTQTGADADRALDCLTAAIYYEARSEAPDGQRAVAQVVLNRVREDRKSVV